MKTLNEISQAIYGKDYNHLPDDGTEQDTVMYQYYTQKNKTKQNTNMILKLTHQFYKTLTSKNGFESRFVLHADDDVVGQMMTENQMRSVIKGLGFEVPIKSIHQQWTVELA